MYINGIKKMDFKSVVNVECWVESKWTFYFYIWFRLKRHPKKFLCLNDNIEDGDEDAAIEVMKVMSEFFESLFPLKSIFELPNGQRNEFTYIEDQEIWFQKQRETRIKILLSCMAASFMVAIFCLFKASFIKCLIFVYRISTRIFNWEKYWQLSWFKCILINWLTQH